MPKRKRIALVACEACRTRKSRVRLAYTSSVNACGKAHTKQCDGITSVCGLCQPKHTECAYSFDPNVSRFAALKSEYEHVKTSLDELSTIYERLKYGSIEGSAGLLERIRTEEGICGFSEDKGTPRRSVDDLQPGDHNTSLVDVRDESQAGYYAWLGLMSSLPSESTPDVGAMSQCTGPIDPNLSGESENHSSFPLSPIVVLQHPGLDDLQTGANPQQDTRSHISVSHNVLLWPEVVRYMRESGLAEAAEPDLQCIVKTGSPWLLQRKTSKDLASYPATRALYARH